MRIFYLTARVNRSRTSEAIDEVMDSVREPIYTTGKLIHAESAFASQAQEYIPVEYYQRTLKDCVEAILGVVPKAIIDR